MQCTGRIPAWLAAILVLAVCTVPPGCVAAKKPLVIGYMGGLSGRTTDLGIAGRDGALLAVEDVNAAGGVDGRDVMLMPVDDAQDATAAAAAFDRLDQAGALAIIGPMTSAVAVVVAPLAKQRGIPVVSPTTSTDALTGIRDWFFRLYPDNSSAAKELANVVRTELGHSRVAMIYDLSNRAHTETWARNFDSAYEGIGGSVVALEPIMSGRVDEYDEAVKGALGVEPDCVFVLANSLDTARLASLIRARGYDGHIITSEWSATEVVIGYGGRAVEGLLFLNTFDRESTSEQYVDFARRFRERFGYEAGFASVHAYDATRLVLSEAVNVRTRDELEVELDALRSYVGVQGPLEFDANGDVARVYHLMTIRDGEFVRAD